MAVWQQVLRVFLAGAGSLACAQGQTGNGNTAPAVETILSRMIQARTENRALLRPYSVTRDYRLFGKDKEKTRAEVIADVTFVPPDVKHFAIQQANGIGLGKRIVREMLEHEAEAVKNYIATDASPANYDFRFGGEADLGGRPCYVLELLPRRKDERLIRGKIWVDADTYLVHRVEGQPAKGPSWWLRDVRIVLTYGDVGGMWLQTASESTTNVRFFGQHTLFSRDMEYKLSDVVVAAAGAPPRGR